MERSARIWPPLRAALERIRIQCGVYRAVCAGAAGAAGGPPAPTQADHAGAVVRLELDEEVTAGLGALDSRQ